MKDSSFDGSIIYFYNCVLRGDAFVNSIDLIKDVDTFDQYFIG